MEQLIDEGPVVYSGFEDAERIDVPDYAHLLPEEIAPFTTGGVYDEIDQVLQEASPAIHAQVTDEQRFGLLGAYDPLHDAAVEALPPEDEHVVAGVLSDSSQIALRYVAFLPAFMFLCYIGLIFYFRSQGGYKPVLLGEEAPGGVEAPVEA